MTNPYEHQEAGTHYVNMGMQPFHFAMVNGWDAGAFSILKYLSRHRTKNGLEDLKKARHFVDLRQAEGGSWLIPKGEVSMGTYIRMNKISGRDATALMVLEEWVASQSHIGRKHILPIIDQLMSEYPVTPLP